MKQYHRGHTLVELVVVMGGLSVVVAVTSVLLVLTLRTSGEVRDQTHAIAVLERLTAQFRRDVHEIEGQPAVSADHRSAELHLANAPMVKWKVVDCIVIRSEGEGKAARRDEFALPPGTSATLETRSRATSRFITLRIESSSANGPAFVVEALAGRNEPHGGKKQGDKKHSEEKK